MWPGNLNPGPPGLTAALRLLSSELLGLTGAECIVSGPDPVPSLAVARMPVNRRRHGDWLAARALVHLWPNLNPGPPGLTAALRLLSSELLGLTGAECIVSGPVPVSSSPPDEPPASL